MTMINSALSLLLFQRKNLIDNDLIDSPEADNLMVDIRDQVIQHWKELTVENIFEALTSIGDAPSLLYDDNGKFAVLSAGVQKAYLEGKHSNFKGVWYGTEESWKPTVREAIGEYIKQLQGVFSNQGDED